jgi:hypothetical protein
MADTRHYDEELRAIGQALAARDSVFEVKELTICMSTKTNGQTSVPQV